MRYMQLWRVEYNYLLQMTVVALTWRLGNLKKQT
jgi:hypothetical protein